MRKTIVRTITATTINSSNITFIAGKPIITENKPITVNGTIDEPKALKEVRKAYGEKAQITDTTEVNDVYEISVEDFMKYATKVVEPTPELLASAEMAEAVKAAEAGKPIDTPTDTKTAEDKLKMNALYGKTTDTKTDTKTEAK